MATRTVIKAIVLAPVAISLVLFSVANRAPVPVVVDPITQGPGAMSIPVPLYALVLGAIILGVLLGGMFTWVAQAKHRKSARASLKAAGQARAEADRLRVELASLSPSIEPTKALALSGAGGMSAPARVGL